MRRLHRSVSVLWLLVLSVAVCAVWVPARASEDLTLWYDEPAEKWLEALPMGNGRLGGMMFGGTDVERIQLNEESLWSGQPLDCNPKGAREHLPRIRKLLFEGKNKKAFSLAQKHLLGDPPRVRSHQSLGQLKVDLDHNGDINNYRRELDLETGICRVTYEVSGVQFTHEAFSSAVDNVVVLRISADEPGALDATVSLSRRQDAESRYDSPRDILLKGQVTDKPDPKRGPGGKHMRFAARARVWWEGMGNGDIDPELTRGEKTIEVRQSQAVTIMLTAATDYDAERMDFDQSRNPAAICERMCRRAADKALRRMGAGPPVEVVGPELGRLRRRRYKGLRQAHKREHRQKFNRVELEIGDSPHPDLPTDERLQKVKDGAHDPQLVEQYFQYGRYLLMGCSRRPGRLPGNLQGIWNKHMNAPWGADYHTNINLQMNQWPATAGAEPRL